MFTSLVTWYRRLTVELWYASVMVDTPQNASENTIIRRKEFAAYRVWRQLPALLRFPPKDSKTGEQPTPQQFAMALGIDDPEILSLIELQTQNDFAARFNVSKDTLSLWNKKLDKLDDLDDLRHWSKKLSKNMLFSMYNHAIRKGNPLTYKLWFQLVNKYVENLKVDTTYKGVAAINVIPDAQRISAP